MVPFCRDSTLSPTTTTPVFQFSMGTVQSVLSPQTALTVAVAAGAIGLGYKQSTRQHAIKCSTSSGTATAPSKKGKKNKQTGNSSALKEGVVNDASGHSAVSAGVLLDPAASANVMQTVPGGLDDVGSLSPPPTESAEPVTVSLPLSKASKAKKKKKTKSVAPAAASASVPAQVPPPHPATYDSDYSSTSPKPPSPSIEPSEQPSSSSSSSSSPFIPVASHALEADGPWTRVESTRRKRGATSENASATVSTSASASASHDAPSADVTTTTTTTTDPGVVTESSSPVAERTEDEAFLLRSQVSASVFGATTRPASLPERKLQKRPIKTAVDDMLETPDIDNPALSRVMRVKPRPGERPASGFSWGDYEDVSVGEGTTGEGNDADGEDEGWDVVKRKRSKPERTTSSEHHVIGGAAAAAGFQALGMKLEGSTTTGSKRQRQNARKRDAIKAAKEDAEAERMATLSRHKKELEKEQFKDQLSKSRSGKVLGGGMTASVDANGKLVWE